MADDPMKATIEATITSVETTADLAITEENAAFRDWDRDWHSRSGLRYDRALTFKWAAEEANKAYDRFRADLRILSLDPEPDKARCQNCGWEGDCNDVEPIEDVWERVQPGDVMPVGDCPKCGHAAMLVRGRGRMPA